jgi:ribosome-binding protein aMBF1 (putative translation factor)
MNDAGSAPRRASASIDRPVANGTACHAGVARIPERAVESTAPKTRTRQSNLLDILVSTRVSQRWSQSVLAAEIGVDENVIQRIEAGAGDVALLVAMMNAIPFQIAGLAAGRTLGEQLRNRRQKLALSPEAIAAKTSLSVQDVERLEADDGSVQHLLRLLSILAPTIRCRAAERAHWGQSRKADRDSRFTPDEFMEPIYRSFGEIDLDPCGHRLSPVIAHHRIMRAEGGDGLVEPWAGRCVFMNPPFSNQLAWLKRAHDQWQKGNVETVVCLVPARTDSQFLQRVVKMDADLYFIEGRVRFLSSEGAPQATPFSLMVVMFGATVDQKARYSALVPGFWVPAGRQEILELPRDDKIKVAEASRESMRGHVDQHRPKA